MRILVVTDGAPHSNNAVVAAGELLAQFGGGFMTLLTVIKSKQDTSQGALILQQARDLLPADAAVLNWCVRSGHTAEQIVKEAESGHYDLIVLGYQRAGRMLKRFLTPTAERVVMQVPCPILIVKGDLTQVNCLLVCESGREPTLLERLKEGLPALLAETVDYMVLHVMSQMVAAPSVPEWQLHASADELMASQTPEGSLLEYDAKLLLNTKTRSAVKIRHGMVVDEILAEAENGRYDIIVIGRHQSQGWERLLLDDVSKMIIGRVNQSILVL
ncbi:MAG: universal stress protein [Chloroflexota bacterium]